MRSRIPSIVLSTVLVLIGATPRAHAQELAGSFDQLRVLLSAGQTITVVDSAGQAVKGKVVALSPTALKLAVAGVTRDFTEKDVDRISQRRPDSLGNGARNGLFVGLGFGVLGGIIAWATEGDEASDVAYILLGAATYGGLGAGIGVGVDALIEKERPIYARRTTGASSFRIGPIAGRDRRGVQVAFRF